MMTLPEIAANWGTFAWDAAIPLEERKAALRTLARDEATKTSARAQSACWLAYRAMEPLGSLEEAEKAQAIAESLLPLVKGNPRWVGSLLIVIVYLKIFRGQDAQVEMTDLPDFNAIRHNPPAALNMLRGTVLLMADHLTHGNLPGARLAVKTAHEIFRYMAAVRPALGLSHHNGNEIVLASKALYIGIALSPYAGCPYKQEPLPIAKVLEIDPTLHFRQALARLLDPAPSLPAAA